MWIDSHCHLQPEHARGALTPAEQLDSARAAGVAAFVCVGTDARTSRVAIDLANAHDDVWATVGLHPHDAAHLDDEWADLTSLARDASRVVAIGECGFDLHYRHSADAEQEVAFRAQVRLAHELDLALVIHTREAWAETFALLDDEGVPARTVLHCFTGGPAEAASAIARDCYVSFSGIVSFKNADDVRAAAAIVPADRFLVETDAPYLAPIPHRGRTNEPALLPFVGAALAAARSESVDATARSSAANAARVFGLDLNLTSRC